jgi:hypothetical protein
VRVADGQCGDPGLTGGVECHGETVGKRGLGKAKLRVNVDDRRTRSGDDGTDIAFDPT